MEFDSSVHMKNLLLFFLFVPWCYFAQDTITTYIFPDGRKIIQVYGIEDTVEISLLSNGKREYTIPLFRNNKSYVYSRYDQKGKLIWKKEMQGDKQHGKTTYYLNNSPVCSINFENGVECPEDLHQENRRTEVTIL
jgi:antitoxin component YwqK of YwqJK toxin-antitoxin module